MSRITTLVFDLGGVLIDRSPDYLYRTLIADEKQRPHRRQPRSVISC